MEVHPGRNRQHRHLQRPGIRVGLLPRLGRDTALSVGAFVALLSLIVTVASVTFGWDWIPRMFLAYLALSALLLLRSRALGARFFCGESGHLTTATFGLLSSPVLIAQQLT